MTRDNIHVKHTTQQAAEFSYLAASSHKRKNRIITTIKWKPPTSNFYKLNTDEAHSATTAGIGGLIRNSNVEWILGFSRTAPRDTSISAELYVLTHELKLAYENNIEPLEVEVDATEVITLLQSDNIPFSNMINDCRYFLGQLDNLVVQHA
uniref:RNase H type-1 domain-containing protein n=2 Tax=Nicotiana TaxID=4085 RepID=A0A1S3X6M2_TOBAC|nr:PREDICTED: uncharacterized protein LOC104242094 [Nicotiana sylvestris]XP_016435635.1 PREDICTED: uncharacterized protein LOC107761858 [Nicotiana tabacum]